MTALPNLDTIVAAAVFIGLRVSGVMLFAPGLSNEAVPARAKIACVVSLVMLLWPVIPLPLLSVSPQQWPIIAMTELLLGIVVGLLLNFIFDAVQFAGQVLGLQMGFSLATMIDPHSQADSPVLSIFHQTLVLLIFFVLDVHHWILRAVVSSFYYFPAGTTVLTIGRTKAILHAASAIWILGLQIAAPALIATLIADFVLAFIGKASPQLPVMLVGISIKSVLGMLVIIATLASWPRFFSIQFANAIRWSEQILHLTS